MSDESYITECLIQPRSDQDGPIFTQLANGQSIIRLRKYAIVPREDYEILLADRDRLRAALDRIATDYDCDPRAEARAALEGKS